MARSTMDVLIRQVRSMANVTTSDYTIGVIDYWSDDQIQEILDRNRAEIFREPIPPIETYSAGTPQYKDYPLQYTDLEKTDGGTAIFYIQDGTETTVGTANYSVDYNRGYVTFNNDTSGSVYYLYARHYDLNAAAAEVWRQKASHYGTAIDFSTDNHSVKRSQLMQQCMKMAEFYEERGGGSTQHIKMNRSDYAVNI